MIGEGEVIIIIIVSIVEAEDIKSSIYQCSMGLLTVGCLFYRTVENSVFLQ